MLSLIRSEPVMFQALAQALIACGAAFGLHLTIEQMAALSGLSAAVLGVITRQLVTPNVKAPQT